jgi:hypothetical protein
MLGVTNVRDWPRPPSGWEPSPLELPIDVPRERPERARRDDADAEDRERDRTGSHVVVIDLA